jgi:hypothetical protein
MTMSQYQQYQGLVKILHVGLVAVGVLCSSAMVEAKDKKPAGGREKIISREGRSKISRDKTKIDFDDESIDGSRKTPMASLLNSTKAKKEYDMVPIRTDWRPEMVQSAASLDAGRSQ